MKSVLNASILISSVLFSIQAIGQKKSPNILYIMSDDHASAAIGAYATTLKGYVDTPNIDRLAAEGAIFSNVQCTNSLCAPSRATILTGRYSHKSGVYTLREDLNTANMSNVPSSLKEQGYQTAVIGKWHVHGDNMYGFDHYAITKSQGSYWNPGLATPDGGKLKRQGYVTDVYTDLSVEWLEERDKSKPFFLMTHYKAAHGPWEFAERHADMFEDQDIPEPENLHDDFSDRSPYGVATAQSKVHKSLDNKMSLSYWFRFGKKGASGQWPTGNMELDTTLSDSEIRSVTYQKYIKDYMRCVKGIDEGVGKLLAYLEDEGELDNTIVIYTSDQGMYIGEHGLFDKRLGLEEAMKMPLIIRYPKTIKSGSQVEELINNVDYAKTLIDMGGATLPDDMQGYSFWPLAQAKKGAKWDRDQSFYSFYSSSVSKHYGITTSDYKYLKYCDTNGNEIGVDLFDRINDRNEMISRADDPDYSDVLADMKVRLENEMNIIDIKEDQLPGKKKSVNPNKIKDKKKKKKK